MGQVWLSRATDCHLQELCRINLGRRKRQDDDGEKGDHCRDYSLVRNSINLNLLNPTLLLTVQKRQSR